MPETTLRLVGATELVIGALLIAPDMAKKEVAEIEEEISKERFSQILRDLAESLDKSRSFQTEIKGYQVTIPEEANIKMEYEQKENGGELELEVKWEEGAA
jgi:amphi-Trp domain-containing protein